MYESSLIPHYFIECGLMRVSQDSSWFVGKCSVTLASVYGSAESSEFWRQSRHVEIRNSPLNKKGNYGKYIVRKVTWYYVEKSRKNNATKDFHYVGIFSAYIKRNKRKRQSYSVWLVTVGAISLLLSFFIRTIAHGERFWVRVS